MKRSFLLISKNFYQNVNKKTYKNKKKCVKLDKEKKLETAMPGIAELKIETGIGMETWYAGH